MLDSSVNSLLLSNEHLICLVCLVTTKTASLIVTNTLLRFKITSLYSNAIQKCKVYAITFTNKNFSYFGLISYHEQIKFKQKLDICFAPIFFCSLMYFSSNFLYKNFLVDFLSTVHTTMFEFMISLNFLICRQESCKPALTQSYI
ncbi:uncharacterized protein ASCRUDRAFT_126569 [Ascoidea rubescens DSM 1968]|uniref:Uncharacterized protein n=1 Tax=Ascoidea rubescens DSM 1968 TaxID=1344418 RepID=A0A1D2VN54_9ASCO|nr:hypothetical protein ASCRUDRAFT_126569 [Ascoidea rubescens DSM 1968]ODV63014.1 hypothetical protein ASCRUDRAFT_126569 [Ascoidea rubescens DSM 1968]